MTQPEPKTPIEQTARRLLYQQVIKLYALTAPDGETWDPPTEDEIWESATEPERHVAFERAREL